VGAKEETAWRESHQFADDTKGGKIINNTDDRDQLQQALNCLCDWAEMWGMSFNLEKCKVMHVGTHNPAYEYFMRGVKQGTTEEERDIGVTVSSNLKPAAQCSKAAVRATAVLGQLRRNFHYRDRFTFLRLYKQYVRPQLEFSAPAWSPWLQGDKDTLEKVQEKTVKMVAGLKGTRYLEKCAELGLDTLEKRSMTKTWPWCTNLSPSPVQQDKQCSTYRMEPEHNRPLEDTAWPSSMPE
jgi:hypothetical protein